MLLHKSSQSLPFDLAKRRHPLGIFSYSMWPRDCHVPRSKCLLPYNLMQVPVYMTKTHCLGNATKIAPVEVYQTTRLVMGALFAFMPEGQTKCFWHDRRVIGQGSPENKTRTRVKLILTGCCQQCFTVAAASSFQSSVQGFKQGQAKAFLMLQLGQLSQPKWQNHIESHPILDGWNLSNQVRELLNPIVLQGFIHPEFGISIQTW